MDENKNTLVINLIGGPCSGKSTVAAGIFYALKSRGINCEMALEYVKDKVWEESFRTMDDQFYIFGKQYHRIWRLCGKVDVVITDNSLLNSVIYDSSKSQYFSKFVVEQFNVFNNRTYFIQRNPNVYQQEGRIQGVKDALNIDSELLSVLITNKIPYSFVPQQDAVNLIVDEYINEIYNKRG